MNNGIMHDTLAKSLEGSIRVPDVVRTLIEERGVESYRADRVRLEETFYGPDGATFSEKISFLFTPIADHFSVPDVMAAIPDRQAGKCKYGEFLNRLIQAGCRTMSSIGEARKSYILDETLHFTERSFPTPNRRRRPRKRREIVIALPSLGLGPRADEHCLFLISSTRAGSSERRNAPSISLYAFLPRSVSDRFVPRNYKE